ncbi:hypothetical protein BS78_02G354100 [Paspalum vaginatum]|nr:hypothetical protein BS78_02G354100 [Paspalum vaginatum]
MPPPVFLSSVPSVVAAIARPPPSLPSPTPQPSSWRRCSVPRRYDGGGSPAHRQTVMGTWAPALPRLCHRAVSAASTRTRGLRNRLSADAEPRFRRDLRRHPRTLLCRPHLPARWPTSTATQSARSATTPHARALSQHRVPRPCAARRDHLVPCSRSSLISKMGCSSTRPWVGRNLR